jgi:hypothetical protein
MLAVEEGLLTTLILLELVVQGVREVGAQVVL